MKSTYPSSSALTVSDVPANTSIVDIEILLLLVKRLSNTVDCSFEKKSVTNCVAISILNVDGSKSIGILNAVCISHHDFIFVTDSESSIAVWFWDSSTVAW